MLIADAAGDGRRRLPLPMSAAVTPAERAAIARELAAEELQGHLVCRSRVLDLVERFVRASVEVAEADLRRRMKEQTRCRN